MKKIFLIILVYLASTISIKAELLYYTFSGEVYYSAENGVKEKDTTKIVFAVDVDEFGFDSYIDPARSNVVYEDYLIDINNDSGYTVDYFYSEVVSGLMIPDSISKPEIEYHTGASYVFPVTTPDNGIYFLSGGNDKDYFYIMSSTSAVNTWKTGEVYDGVEIVKLSDTSDLWISSDLTLTSITKAYLPPESPKTIYTPYVPPPVDPPPVSNVPEPPISLTLPLGFAFIYGICILLRKKTDTDDSNCNSFS